jgi:hypothetical protein
MSEGQVIRRVFLKQAGAVGVVVAGGTLWATAPAVERVALPWWTPRLSIW